ncbi:MAG: hypothetical protein PUD71_01840 [Lachnospiraceae bacterium]|nr:hypothetical protein [Lachnospiraceae bacterium]MDD6857100.1 hypothetical protein [Lachnospiraceae bacterium]
MNIGEARGRYGALLKSYNEEKFKLSQQRKQLDERINSTENGKELYGEEAATLELKYNAVKDKQDEYQKYMNDIMEQWQVQFDKVAAKQQARNAKEYGAELGKIMEVARRIIHGDTVPASDEKKLMEFDSDLYQMAKSAGEMAKRLNEKRKKYKSLWEDEEDKTYEDPMESADSKELDGCGPDVVSVQETMDAAVGGNEE